ncbi:MAG: GntR family transcriptional regulator [Pseudomonadota bacterium]
MARRTAASSLVSAPKGGSAREVYRRLRERILRLELAPDLDLDEATLVTMMGVSRTPVREALIRLAADGLVLLLPNRGARVAPISLHGVRAFFESLDLVQRAMTRLAAERRSAQDLARIEQESRQFDQAAARRDVDAMSQANFDFHMAIAAAAQNAYLGQAYELLLFQGLRLSRISLAYRVDVARPKRTDGSSSRISDIIDQHRAMVQAIAKGDAAAAEALAAEHVAVFRRRVFKFQAENLLADVKIAAAD